VLIRLLLPFALLPATASRLRPLASLSTVKAYAVAGVVSVQQVEAILIPIWNSLAN